MGRSEREVEFWSCYPDREDLQHRSIEDAVEEWRENLVGLLDDETDVLALPETVTVYGYAQMPLPFAEHIGERALEAVIDWLDEEHGNPDDYYTEPSQAMRAAANAFGEAIRANYVPWMCEQITSREVRLAEVKAFLRGRG